MSEREAVDSVWVCVGALSQIPQRGARVVETSFGDIAVFRTRDDEVFALDDRCPHQGGPLSQGLVHGRRVTCPLHDTVVCLSSGRVLEGGTGRTRQHAVRVIHGRVYLALGVSPARTADADPSA
ncbi:MAG: nitrite reductase small subunit NirD [Polyangiales bacterium]